MRKIIKIDLLAFFLLATAQAQTSGKAEFEVASIKANAPQPGFHFAANAASGGPGTADPRMFRCSKCTLSTLIVKAFNLQPYQFPGRTSLSDNTYEIAAKIPADATDAEFSAMLQNLLKERFGLTWHFQEKQMKGYQLTVAKNGPKLRESSDAPLPTSASSHSTGQTESHNHIGVVNFGTAASYRAVNVSTADLARILSEQIGLSVDDKTGLAGKYDIALRWSGDPVAHGGSHSDGAFSGGAGHGNHDGGGGSPSGADPSGPTIFDALQQQLGLKLVPAEQGLARLFVVDRVAKEPAEN